ncbi:MAG: hypothetical protein KAG66_03175, partial [Methylococcales bacterium]|nr:hypothetical protein [Methylococcales bacterium]
MWLKAFSAFVLLLFTVSITRASNSSCQRNGPDNCTFEGNTFCGWSNISWTLKNLRANGGRVVNRYAFIQPSTDHPARLESRLACSTRASHHCLIFDYVSFDFSSDRLAVLLQCRNGTESEVWNNAMQRESISYWKRAAVSITTGPANFRVVFQATRCDARGFFGVDNITYVHYSCQTILTTGATPETTKQTVASSANTAPNPTSKATKAETTALITGTKSTSPSTASGDTTAPPTPSLQSPSPDRTTAVSCPPFSSGGRSLATTGQAIPHEQLTSRPTADSSDGKDVRGAAPDPANHVVVIVAAVVAGVVVIGIIVLVLVLLRRNRLLFWKSSLDGNRKGDQGRGNKAYDDTSFDAGHDHGGG